MYSHPGFGGGNLKHFRIEHGRKQEAEDRVLKSYCSAAGPLLKLIAMGAASESLRL